MKKIPGATEEENRILEPEAKWVFTIYGLMILFYGIFSVVTAWMV